MKYLIGIIIGISISAIASPPKWRIRSDFRDPTVIQCIGGKRYLCRPELRLGSEQTCGY